MAASFIQSLNLIGRHDPTRVRAALVSRDFFPMLNLRAIIGRTFAGDEHQQGAGVATGLLASFALSRFLASLLFQVKPHDLRSMAAAPLALGAVAVIACVLPAIRAARVDPMVALRSE